MTCQIVMFALHMGTLPPSRPSTFMATCRPLSTSVARLMTRSPRLSALSMSGDVRKEASESIRVAVDYVQGPDDRDGCMAAATVRCCAFYGGSEHPAFIDDRFSLFGAVKARQGKGAACLIAKLAHPWGEDVLERLGSAPELRSKDDLQAFEALCLARRGTGGRGASKIVKDWSDACRDRTVVIGAADVSTHEFELSSVWLRERTAGQDAYLSDMAVHPAFQRLGVGQELLRACLEYSKSRGFSEIHLHVEDDNPGAAKLYDASGFCRAKECDLSSDLFDALMFMPPPAPLNVHMRRPL